MEPLEHVSCVQVAEVHPDSKFGKALTKILLILTHSRCSRSKSMSGVAVAVASMRPKMNRYGSLPPIESYKDLLHQLNVAVY